MTRLTLLLSIFAAIASCQVALYGTLGAVDSNYWSNPALAYGAGASFTHKRASIGAEVWRSEVGSQRNPLLNADRRAEAVIAAIGYRVWRGVHIEGGGGVQRLTDSAYGPLFEGVWKYTQTFGTAGAYYQHGNRFFTRVGYRHLFVVNDHDTQQVYVGVGIKF